MTTGSVRVRRAVGALLAVLAAVLTVLGAAGTASAHAELESTDPAQNSVVRSAPSAVTLTFGEGVTLPSASLRVFDPAGERVDTGTPGHAAGRDDTARIALRDGLRDGTYTVAWQVISGDSHPLGGAFVFSVGAPSASSVSTEEFQGARTDSVIAFLYGTAGVVAYGSFALLAGAVAFVLTCWPAGVSVRPVQKLLAAGWIGLLGSTVILMMLRGPYEQGGGLFPSDDPAPAHVDVDERIYFALAARLLLLVASAVFLVLLVGALGQPGTEAPRRSRVRLGAAGLVLAVGMAFTWVSTDHASEGPQVWLALPLTALHLLAMAAWLGGLATLAAGLRHGLAPAAVRRFSAVALSSVTVLVATGLYRAWREVGPWDALFDTRYGQLLLLKGGFVALMVAAAWVSRSRLARLRAGEPAGEDGESVPPAGRAGAPVQAGASAGSGENHANDESARPSRGAVSVQADEEGETPAPRGTSAPGDTSVPGEVPVPRDSSSPHGDDATVRAGLRRSVLTESAVAVAVLTVTTLLTSSPPGRTADDDRSTVAAASPALARTVTSRLPFDTGGGTPDARGEATLRLVPAKSGGYALRLELRRVDGTPAEVPEVRLALALPARDLGPLRVPLKRDGAGRWAGSARLALAGEWTVSMTVRSSDIDQATSERKVPIGR
ncbi:copper resistance protein CopC [Streptomyces sp. NPDC005017]|uniref:copper resistance CopC/CopD family protein n=1 Tax=Streptomyces sp. NPDC005017 TaxID=3364706 RepID=UPI0036BDFC88